MRGGVYLEGKKEASLLAWTIRRPRPLKQLRIPLSSHPRFADATPCVRSGDEILAGDPVATPADPDGVWVYAGLSGTVRGVAQGNHPVGGDCLNVEIDVDEERRPRETWQTPAAGWEAFSTEEVIQRLRRAGVVNTDFGMEPLHVRLRRERDRGVLTLILNGCESEPYVTCEHALMMSHPLEVIKGAEILRKALNASRVLLALEDNKLEVIELLKSRIYFLKWDHITVATLPTRYPQEHPYCLAESLNIGGRRRVPDHGGGQPVFFLPSLAFAVYEAVVLGKPFFERAVTVGGECVVEPRNVWLPFGALFSDALKTCRGLLREPAKLVMGGPMRGIAQWSQEIAVVPGTSAVLALPPEVAAASSVEACLRCGQCDEVCPAGLVPSIVTRAVEQGAWEEAARWGVERCLECGSCAYVCPAKRPMLDMLKLGKTRRPGKGDASW